MSQEANFRDEWLTADEICKVLGVSVGWFNVHVRPFVPFVHLNRKRYNLAQVKDWILKHLLKNRKPTQAIACGKRSSFRETISRI